MSDEIEKAKRDETTEEGQPTAPALRLPSMPRDSSAPATKQDIRLLMEHIGGFYDKCTRRIGKVEERLTGLDKSMHEWKKEIIHEFQVAVENIRHDLEGANKDRIENHDHRLIRLEEHTGLSPA